MKILYQTLPPGKCLSFEDVSPHDLISSHDSLIRITPRLKLRVFSSPESDTKLSEQVAFTSIEDHGK